MPEHRRPENAGHELSLRIGNSHSRVSTLPGSKTGVAVIGIGQSEFGRRGTLAGRSERALACDAILAACQDAGIDVEAVDGVASHAYDRTEPALLQESLGLPRLRFCDMVWGGGGNGAFASINHAVAAIRSGAATTVVVVRSLQQQDGKRFSEYAFPHAQNFHRPFGVFSPAAAFAPIARRYLEEFDVRPEELGQVSLAFRRHANRNPRALFHDKPASMDDYMSSRMVADPLRLLDCCLESDGACAVVLTSSEAARRLGVHAIEVVAAAEGQIPGWGTGVGAHNMPEEAYLTGAAGYCAEQLYGASGLGPTDIDVVQFYDHFSPIVLLQLETFGFCKPGQAGRAVGQGLLAFDGGGLPTNTSGGHLSEAYIHGLNLLLESVRQLRGSSTAQVKGARFGLVAAGASAVLLGDVL